MLLCTLRLGLTFIILSVIQPHVRTLVPELFASQCGWQVRSQKLDQFCNFRCESGCQSLFVSLTVWGLAFWWARLQVKICSLMEEARSEFAPWLTNFQLLSCSDQQHRQPLIMSSTASPVTNCVIRNGHKVFHTLANDWHIFKCSLVNQDKFIHRHQQRPPFVANENE